MKQFFKSEYYLGLSTERDILVSTLLHGVSPHPWLVALFKV